MFASDHLTRSIERNDVFSGAAGFVVAQVQKQSESAILVEVMTKLGVMVLGSTKVREPANDPLRV
jgi:hypothetical protein